MGDIESKPKGSKVSAENVKWRVNMAVRKSNLPSAARLVMFVLSDMADAKTGLIPMKHSPSLADLARETGLGQSTVKAQLASLEQMGWVRRSRPTGGERARHVPTYYQLMVGSPGEERAPAKRNPMARSKPSEEGPDSQEQAIGDSQEMAIENESDGQEQADRWPGDSSSMARSRPSYLKDDDLDDPYDPFLGADADASAPTKGRNGATKVKTEAPPRPDVDALCQRLAELLIANECKPPTISQHWRDEARRMLDIDKRPFDKAMALLEWSQSHHFWKTNIHSMPTFRKQYDKLRQQANAEWEQARTPFRNGHQPYRNPTDLDAYEGPIR